MAEEHDEEMQEMMEEMAEDLEGTQLQEKNLRQKSGLSVLTSQGQLLLYGGIGLLVLIILLFFVFGRGEKVPTHEINAMKGRLDRVENKLIQIESVARESLRLKEQIQEIEKTVSKLDRSLRALREQLSQQSQALDRVQKSSGPTAKKIEPAPVAKKKEPASQTQRRMHEVVRGDTLFRIAKKYGVSLDELRRLNKFSKTQAIYAGQKIIIP
ncbi:MAG: LysM peptidoglycan-binding domain-containing protein [Pseudomonadota bacterium]